MIILSVTSLFLSLKCQKIGKKAHHSSSIDQGGAVKGDQSSLLSNMSKFDKLDPADVEMVFSLD